MEKPQLTEAAYIPELAALKDICEEYMEFLEDEDFHEDNDYDNYVYEKAMELMYGPKVWDYINSKIK